jgi:hypothetical protein
MALQEAVPIGIFRLVSGKKKAISWPAVFKTST